MTVFEGTAVDDLFKSACSTLSSERGYDPKKPVYKGWKKGIVNDADGVIDLFMKGHPEFEPVRDRLEHHLRDNCADSGGFVRIDLRGRFGNST